MGYYSVTFKKSVVKKVLSEGVVIHRGLFLKKKYKELPFFKKNNYTINICIIIKTQAVPYYGYKRKIFFFS